MKRFLYCYLLVAKPTLQDRKACRNAPCMFGHPHMFGCPLYVLMMFGCPLYICKTKKACFVRLRGVSICPNTFGCPHMFGWPPYVWTPHMFGCPLYVWISPICLDTPISLIPPVCLDDVWIPAVHIQHKECMFCQTKGVSICPHTFE